MKNESHIRVVLKDNTILDFDGKCTNVEYENDKFCKFINKNYNHFYLLALIPYENIAYIDNYPYQKA